MSTSTYCGILNINKPPEITSRRVVDAVQRLVRPAKAGHAGTLDPMATGVLVVCVGSATRLTPYVQQGRKEYLAEFLLGSRSNTDDITGKVAAVQDAVQPSMDEILAAIPNYIGEIDQIPPQFSAVHIDGQRAYKLARAGENVEIEPRRVQIDRIDVIDFAFPTLEVEIDCGSGTYIRSLGRDLGQELGCGAVLSKLVRTRVGPFAISESIELSELSAQSFAAAIQPSLVAVGHLPRHTCSLEEIKSVHHGLSIRKPEYDAALTDEEFALLTPDGQLAAIAEVNGNSLAPKKVFLASKN